MIDASAGDFGEQLLGLVTARSPTFRGHLHAYGDEPLHASINSLAKSLAWTRPDGFSLDQEFLRVIYDETQTQYGAERAKLVETSISRDPSICTANHFGLDTFADSVQGSMLLSHGLHPDGSPLVVLASGTISLDNLTYPGGLLLYDVGSSELTTFPQKLPFFRNGLRHSMALTFGPISEAILERAHQRIARDSRTGKLTPFERNSVEYVLDSVFEDRSLFELPTYSLQVSKINERLWERMFKSDPPIAPVILQLESVVSRLLLKDIGDTNSLPYHAMFIPALRDRIVRSLNGVKGCWTIPSVPSRIKNLSNASRGTAFFWSRSPTGSRVALVPVIDDGKCYLMERRDNLGRRWSLDPHTIGIALEKGELIPSLVSCFMVLLFSRMVSCIGGYYQVEYLTAMKHGLLKSFELSSDYEEMANKIRNIPTEACWAALQGITRVLPSGEAIPAGPIEIIGAGGLHDSDLDQLVQVTRREANLLSLTEMLPHFVPKRDLPVEWRRRLAFENGACRLHDVITLEC